MYYLTIVLIFVSTVCSGQSPRTGDNTAGQPQVAKKKLALSAHTGEEAYNLETLTRLSDLIMDGKVIGILPSVLRNPNQPTSIETAAIVAVDKVLHGPASLTASKVLVIQAGGIFSDLEVAVPNDPPILSGERYILFLRLDPHATVADHSSYTRYVTAGAWAGKVHVTNSAVSFLPPADARLHAYDNTPVDAFSKTVVDLIQGNVAAPPRSGVPWPGAGAVVGAGTLRKPQ